MGCKYLIVSSVTYAMKAKEILESHGINSKIEKIKKVRALNGCGFGLKIDSDSAVNAARFLSISGVRVVESIDCEAVHK